MNEAEKIDVEVFTTGDNVYSSGTASQHVNCWGPSWGDTAKRIMKNIRPSPCAGNASGVSQSARSCAVDESPNSMNISAWSVNPGY